MRLNFLNKWLDGPLTLEGSCNLIMVEHHPVILEMLEQSKHQLEILLHSGKYHSTLLPQLSRRLFQINKEIGQYIRAEQEYFFPYLKKQSNQESACDEYILNTHLLETMQEKHDLFTKALHQQRKIVNNYMIKKDWDTDLKNYINHLFLLEKKIQSWMELERKKLYPYLIKTTRKHE
ncbi:MULTISPECIES: hypothetical protein [unclassified Hydrotalea]|nr:MULTISPECIES: hypothetical protein [unclassified Hydrotalea]RWZ88365.1 MAG: hypothetical protein EO766_08225 [Hydrotalea sp. AMD]